MSSETREKPKKPCRKTVLRNTKKLREPGAIVTRLLELSCECRNGLAVADFRGITLEQQLLKAADAIMTGVKDKNEVAELVAIARELMDTQADKRSGSAERASMGAPLSYKPDPDAPTH